MEAFATEGAGATDDDVAVDKELDESNMKDLVNFNTVSARLNLNDYNQNAIIEPKCFSQMYFFRHSGFGPLQL